MSLQSQLTRMARNVGALNADTNAIFEALRAKGVDVPANAQLGDVVDMIETIEVLPSSVEIGGRNYPVVKIGNQLWLAENLSVNAGIWVEYPNEPERGKYYFDNTGVGNTPFGAITELLPNGWRIPSSQDFQTLIDFCSTDSGTKLKSTEGWINDGNGTDAFGFNAIPCGRYSRGDSFGTSITRMERFWTSDSAYIYDTAGTIVRAMFNITADSTEAALSAHNINEFYLNIRLVKDVS